MSPIVSMKLLKLRSRIKKSVFTFTLAMECFTILFAYRMVHRNGAYTYSVTSAIFWLMLLPTYVFYLFYGKCFGILLNSCYTKLGHKMTQHWNRNC